MPISFTVDHRNRRVTSVATGVVTIADITQYVAERVRLGVFDYAQLVDAKDVTAEFPPTESLYASVMEARRELNVGTTMPRTAIIANPGTAPFGYARQIATQLGFAKMPIEVFTNRSDAEQWLAGKTGAEAPQVGK